MCSCTQRAKQILIAPLNSFGSDIEVCGDGSPAHSNRIAGELLFSLCVHRCIYIHMHTPTHKGTLSRAHRKVRDEWSGSELSAGSQEPQRSRRRHLKRDSVTF